MRIDFRDAIVCYRMLLCATLAVAGLHTALLVKHQLRLERISQEVELLKKYSSDPAEAERTREKAFTPLRAEPDPIQTSSAADAHFGKPCRRDSRALSRTIEAVLCTPEVPRLVGITSLATVVMNVQNRSAERG